MQKLLIMRSYIDKLFLASFILMVPLYQKFPLLRIPGVSVSIRLEDFLLALALIYILPFYAKRIRVVSKTPIFKAIAIFLVIGLISLVSGILLTKTIPTTYIGFLHWARRIEYFIPLLFVLSLPRNNSHEYVEFAVKLLIIVVVISFIYGFGQKNFNWPVIVTQNEEYSKGIALRYVPGAHITSTFAGHYDLASFMVLILPIMAACYFTLKGRATKFFMAVTLILGLWLLANSLSRISVAAYLVGIIFTFILLKKIKALIIVLVVSILVFSFSSDLLDRYFSIFRVIKESVGQSLLVKEAYAVGPSLPGRNRTPSILAAFEDRSTSIRLNVEWPRALRSLIKNPLLGTGYSSITLATDNDYLRLLGEVGILGFGSFMLILLLIIRNLMQLSKNQYQSVDLGFAVGSAGGFFGSLLNATFIDIFEASKFAISFWLIMGFILLMSNVKNGKKS